jgi:hypothetical protein
MIRIRVFQTYGRGPRRMRLLGCQTRAASVVYSQWGDTR